ncbi:MAG TPA: adenylyl-sulfate kinase [Lentisphaeria bacterium]|nr:MAG: adenylyl-sulfate kinase [Lentisphaerae bacterium GWF2_49_21]HBC86970.1 adenylyl-sulfate kinase [Lentisphaeria bacterium]
METKNLLKIVIVGHVDHGKSTIIGRLLADTGSLPNGKLEQVQENCRRNSKPFEYAFLLDALKNEQRQGITIDMARCFFKTANRNYMIIDAPGHIEFLKNMVTGAARADAALLVIDAHEGIQENSKRHGYILGMLGIKQVAVIINKFDLADYKKDVYENIVKEYSEFLKNIGVTASSFIPASGRFGDNIVKGSENISWYKGPSILEQLETFALKPDNLEKSFRMPVQDIYKFTEQNDERRIVAGTIETGSIKVGDDVVFLPSGKENRISSIEGFNSPVRKEIGAPYATGFTLATQIYINPGEIMCKKGDALPTVASRFHVNIFWMGKAPFIKGKKYKLKLAAARVNAELVDIINVLDASELSSIKGKKQLDRHDVGECIIETLKPIAFDFVTDIESTGRFVIVDNYEIAGGGIVIGKAEDESSLLKDHVQKREYSWERGLVTSSVRAGRNHHRGKFIVFTGDKDSGTREIAKNLEQGLFNLNLNVYYLGMSSLVGGLDSDMKAVIEDRDEHIRRIGELARIMTDAGLIFITVIDGADEYDLDKLKLLNSPNEILVVNVGENYYTKFSPDLNFPANTPVKEATEKIKGLMSASDIIPSYCI